MLESKVLGDGTKTENSMNRRTTWKKATSTRSGRSGKTRSNRSGSITSEETDSFDVYSSPTTVLEARVPRKSTKTIKTMKIMIGLRSKEIPIIQDKSVAATKITQVSETECKVSERALWKTRIR